MSKKHTKPRKREFLTRYKNSCVCAACGIGRDIEFHHRNPAEKRGRVSDFLGSSWQRLIDELLKCDPLCKHCHIAVHYEGLVYESPEIDYQKIDDLVGEYFSMRHFEAWCRSQQEVA